jgi:Protein of unknown function (DUF3565)
MVTRKSVGGHPDEVGDWVAVLACGHGRHRRRKPPWEDRPWVLRPKGCQRQLGVEVDCSTCDAEEQDHRGAHAAMDRSKMAVAWLFEALAGPLAAPG